MKLRKLFLFVLLACSFLVNAQDNRIELKNQLQKSSVAGSMVVTDGDNEQYYLPPGAETGILTIQAGVPTWIVGGSGEQTTVTDQVNGLDINLAGFDITINTNIPELTAAGSVQNSLDYVYLYDASAADVRKATVLQLLETLNLNELADVPAYPTGTTSTYFLTRNDVTDLNEWTNADDLGNNIYNSDGTIDSERTVYLDGNSFFFYGGDGATQDYDAAALVFQPTLGGRIRIGDHGGEHNGGGIQIQNTATVQSVKIGDAFGHAVGTSVSADFDSDDGEISFFAPNGFFVEGTFHLQDYIGGSPSGTAAYNLVVDASGNVLVDALGGGGGGGNFAEDNLTADANRTHDFVTFDLSIGNNTDVNQFVIDASEGDVGIGVAAGSILAKNHIYGVGGASNFVQALESNTGVAYNQIYTSTTGNNGTNDGTTFGVNSVHFYIQNRESGGDINLNTEDSNTFRVEADGDVVVYEDDDATIGMFWDASQNGLAIGKGATAPGTSFEVDSKTNTQIATFENDNKVTTEEFQIYQNANGGGYFFDGLAGWYHLDGGNDHQLLNSGGSPRLEFDFNTAGVTELSNATSSNELYIRTNSADAIRMLTNSSFAMTLNTDQTVTLDGYTGAVAGTAAYNILVDANGKLITGAVSGTGGIYDGDGVLSEDVLVDQNGFDLIIGGSGETHAFELLNSASIEFTYDDGGTANSRIGIDPGGSIDMYVTSGTGFNNYTNTSVGKTHAINDGTNQANDNVTPTLITMQVVGSSTTGTMTVDDEGTNILSAFNTTGEITPAQITGNTNDYSPSGLSSNYILNLDFDGSYNLTGLNSAAAGTGTRKLLYNSSANDQTITNKDASSSAANQFRCPNNVNFTWYKFSAIEVIYLDSKWQIISQ